AKAVQRTNELKRKTYDFARNFLPIAFNFIKTNHKLINEYYLNFRKKMGIDKVKPDISAEVSDFLVATREAINKLPFAYQRLLLKLLKKYENKQRKCLINKHNRHFNKFSRLNKLK
ncbi:hypothetical protein ACFLSQ_11670, partial [Bacteroidota bacterium]